MRNQVRVALFGHAACHCKFFVKLKDALNPHYHGKCPNPHCNRSVNLMPKKLYNSIDKARREYIKLMHHDRSHTYWQNG